MLMKIHFLQLIIFIHQDHTKFNFLIQQKEIWKHYIKLLNHFSSKHKKIHIHLNFSNISFINLQNFHLQSVKLHNINFNLMPVLD